MDNAKPFIEKLIKREFKISDMAKDLAGDLLKYGKLFRDLPDQLSSALKRIQRGKIKVDIEETDIKRLGRDIDVSANRLTYSLMVAAFLVAGALLANMGEPQLYGFPLFSFVCFAMAFIFLIPLIISIQKQKNE